MKAFVGHSFGEEESRIAREIIEFLESIGVKCETGERAENAYVSAKVKKKIGRNAIFIGIFMEDREIILKKRLLFKNDVAFTTSNWVIQESGYAIGKDKEILLLREPNIYKFPKLQGDLELIYFDRKKLHKLFTKLGQVIQSIKDKKITGTTSQREEKTEEIEKEVIEDQGDKIKKEAKKKIGEAFKNVFDALFEEKDYKKAQKAFNERLKPRLKGNEVFKWEGIILRLSHKMGDKSAFDKLIKNASENKDNPEIIYQLAYRYKEIREFKKAKEKFLIAGKLWQSDSPKNAVDCYEQASLCLAFDGLCEEAYTLLIQLIHDNQFKEQKAEILTGLAKVAKMAKDWHRFFTYAEGSLNINPVNTDLRFDLAYRYSDEGLKRISLLHYRKLNETMPTDASLNNIGVQYEILGMSAKSVKGYLKAVEYNSTLAMANLAQRYLNKGFVKQAEELVNGANKLAQKGIEVDGKIGVVKRKLDEMLETEEEKEKDLLFEAEKERKFRSEYSEAFICERKINKEEIDGMWDTPYGVINIQLDEKVNTFKANGLHKGQNTEHTELEESSIEIKGSLSNCTGKYKIKTYGKTEWLGKVKEREITYSATGYMIIDEDGKSLHVMEKTENDETRLSKWDKVIRKPIKTH